MSRVWLVTGSSRGLGLALAEAVLASGDSLVATARKSEQLSHLVDKYGPEKVLPVSLDVTENDQVRDAVHMAVEKFSRLDVVVNNAGYADTTSIEDMELDTFRAQVETNLFGVVNVTKAVLPLLRRQGSGHIIQISSIGGRTGSPGLSAYQAAKWAVGGFSTVLSKEISPFGVNVTIVEPGGMNTDWAGSSMKDLPLSEPYQQTVGTFKEMRNGVKDQWLPPGKYADAILHISKVSDPPLHLLLGPDAFQFGKFLSDELSASDEKWRDVSLLSF